MSINLNPQEAALAAEALERQAEDLGDSHAGYLAEMIRARLKDEEKT
jgi:hypothetical protein